MVKVETLQRKVDRLESRLRSVQDRLALAEHALKQLIIVGGQVPKFK